MKLQRIFLYTTLLLLSMSCSLELPENIKSLKTCIKATGITATPQSSTTLGTTTLTLNLGLTGTTNDIAKVVWVVSQNSTEYSRSSTITSSPFSLTTPTIIGNGTHTIMAQIVDKCGVSYNLTSDIVISNFVIEMLPVEGGTFQMGDRVGDGDSDERPLHSVILSSFNISKYEITQAQWKAVMGSNPSYFTNCDNCPVESVSWEDVQLFLTKLNKLTSKTYRLPTEAEWEYVARGGKLNKGYTYSGSNTIGDVAWYSDNGDYKTHPVGQKAANELGVYDMSGNVYEWCQDWYGDYTSDTQQNPTGASTGSTRVLRGGSWFDAPQISRVANRVITSPGNRGRNFGFRVVFSQ